VVSAADPYGIRGSVDVVPDPLLLTKSRNARGIEPVTSGSVATNSDH
jgi:hypothetical protein